MKRALGFAIVVSVMIAGVAIADMEDGRTPVHPYVQTPDGGMIRTQADELGRAYVRLVSADGGVPEVRGTVAVTSPDGGIPEVSLGDLGTSARPLPAEIVADGAAVGAANPLPQSIWGAARGATPAASPTVSTLGNDRAGVDVALRSLSGELLGTETNRLATNASATVQNLGPSAIYCCLQTGCTAATGMRVLPGGSMYRGIGPSVGIFCISASGDADVRVEEVR